MGTLYSQIHFFRADHGTYEEAKKCNAVYNTPSTIDAVMLDGFSTTGLFDVIEVIKTTLKALGMEDQLIYGVIYDDGKFVELNELAQKESQ